MEGVCEVYLEMYLSQIMKTGSKASSFNNIKLHEINRIKRRPNLFKIY